MQAAHDGNKLKKQGESRPDGKLRSRHAPDAGSAKFLFGQALASRRALYWNIRGRLPFSSMQNVTLQSGPAKAPALTQEKARVLARDAGFNDAGLVALPYGDEPHDGARFAAWIGAGHAGAMQYLERRDELGRLLRESVQVPFPWARSVLVCFASYNTALPRSTDTHADDAAWMARYAWSSRVDGAGARRPSDYHKILKKRLDTLETALRAEFRDAADFQARGFADTGPVQERALARAAGLGWMGKNTCLIHPQLGSFGFLAVLITSLAVSVFEENFDQERSTSLPPFPAGNAGKDGAPADGAVAALVPDRCGSCTRCLTACPTNALTAPHQMDATRCISYLTIEKKGVLDEGLLAGMGRQVFGCDICQDVCPWNRKAVVTADVELEPREELVNPSLAALGALTEAAFEEKFNGSPVRRAGYLGLLRNVAVAMGNSGAARHRERLAGWAEASDQGLRAAARWALGRLP
jgi:epoxyqueuosine reductase